MHQNFQTDRRPVARASTRGSGDAPGGLCALSPGRSRSWSRLATPGSPSLQTARSPSVSSYTRQAALSAFTAPSPSKWPPHPHPNPSTPVGRMRLLLDPPRLSDPNYRFKRDPVFSLRFYANPIFPFPPPERKKNLNEKNPRVLSSKGCLGILLLSQVPPEQICACLMPVNPVLHRRKRSISFACPFQWAAPTPLKAIVFLGTPDNIHMRSKRNSSSLRLDPPCDPSPVCIQQRQLHRRPEPDAHDYPIPVSSSYTSIHSHL